MKRWVRIFGKANPEEWDGNVDVIIDAMVTVDNRLVQSCAFFGVWGKLGDSDAAPFVLYPNGEVDLGCYVEGEGEERQAKLNLHEKSIQVGEYFTWFHEHDEILLRVTSVSDLTEI